MNTIDTSTIEDVVRRRDRAEKQRVSLARSITVTQEQLTKVKIIIKNLNGQLAKIRICEKAPKVSDHAVLRYLERHKNIDIDGIRNDLLTKDVKAAMKLGVKNYKTSGMEFIIVDNTIVTIY